MKIIDVNCAVGAPLKSDRFISLDGLYQWMDDYHIDSAVTYQAEAIREPEKYNLQMCEMAAASGGKLRACMVINPSLENLGLPGDGSPIERLKALRPSAVRLFPDEQQYIFDPFYCECVLDVCQQLRMPLLLTKQYDQMFFHCLPEVAKAYPDVPIILPRAGQNKSRYYFPILQKLPNVYLDMSISLDVGNIEEVCNRFGSHRLLFGSGLPTYEPSGGFGLLMYSNISDEERENIAHANFERLERGIRYDD